MIHLRTFFIILFLTCAALFALHVLAPPVDVFNPRLGAMRDLLLKLPAQDQARAKLHHARNAPQYKLAVFGNSRSKMLGARHFPSLRDDEFFNFSIGGQSFRHSVRMLVALEKMGKLPDTAVLSFDHVELGLPGGNPVTPGPLGRLVERSREAVLLSRTPGLSLKEITVFVYNNLITEARYLCLAFNAELLLSRVRYWFAYAAKSESQRMRADGSAVRNLNKVAAPVTWKKSERRAELYRLLEYDFEILASLRRAGTRIIVYESPLAPEIAASVEKTLSQNARNVRVRLFRACRANGIECRRSPFLKSLGKAVAWSDATHPPGQLLGNWVRKQLEPCAGQKQAERARQAAQEGCEL